jgi:hypothetical protein
MRRQPISIGVLTLVVWSTGCRETFVSHYESVKQARADRLFERGWIPDVLPDDAGPLIEAHNIDTNARCAVARFSPGAFDDVIGALSREGFEPYHGHVPSRPLRACPYHEDEVRNASIALQRRRPDDAREFAAIDRRGTLVYVVP